MNILFVKIISVEYCDFMNTPSHPVMLPMNLLLVKFTNNAVFDHRKLPSFENICWKLQLLISNFSLLFSLKMKPATGAWKY